tara:strand:- start:1 stop:549 length:549 start_codon:yes stop_codon:yes gene_type:complete
MKLEEMNIGIIWGSDSGDTEDVMEYIVKKLSKYNVETIHVESASVHDFTKFDLLLLGISTWYDGDLQSDWERFFPTFQEINFSDKSIAIFGLGDQYSYEDYFVDGIGILAKEVIRNEGKIIGNWPTEGYEFVESKALLNKDLFYGLALDEGNQYELTKDRVDKWLSMLGFILTDLDVGVKSE